MVHRAQYLSRLIAAAAFLTGIIACQLLSQEKRVVPDMYTDATRMLLIEKDGITYAGNNAFSGIAYALNGNGDTMFIYPYNKGKIDGETREWYENGQLKEIRYYEQGRKTGIHKGWYANGQKRFVYHMEADHFEGNAKEWYEDGTLAKDFNYVNGQEEGMEKMYWSNGKVRANYQSVKGRKYGLTGVKNCVSVWTDSIGKY